MKSTRFFAAAAAFACLSTASFAVELVTNGSFENPTPDSSWTTTVDGSYIAGSFTGWTAAGMAGAWRPSAGMFTSMPDGVQAGWASDTVTGGSLRQYFSHTIAVGEVVTISGSIGDRSDLFAGWGATTAGTVTLYTSTNFPLMGVGVYGNGTTGKWTSFTASSTPGALDAFAGQTLYIELASVGGAQASFDNISVQVVPEPSTLAMFGLMGLALVRKRRS